MRGADALPAMLRVHGQLARAAGDRVGGVEVREPDECPVGVAHQEVRRRSVATVPQVQQHVFGQRRTAVGRRHRGHQGRHLVDLGLVQAARHDSSTTGPTLLPDPVASGHPGDAGQAVRDPFPVATVVPAVLAVVLDDARRA